MNSDSMRTEFWWFLREFWRHFLIWFIRSIRCRPNYSSFNPGPVASSRRWRTCSRRRRPSAPTARRRRWRPRTPSPCSSSPSRTPSRCQWDSLAKFQQNFHEFLHPSLSKSKCKKTQRKTTRKSEQKSENMKLRKGKQNPTPQRQPDVNNTTPFHRNFGRLVLVCIDASDSESRRIF